MESSSMFTGKNFDCELLAAEEVLGIPQVTFHAHRSLKD